MPSEPHPRPKTMKTILHVLGRDVPITTAPRRGETPEDVSERHRRRLEQAQERFLRGRSA